MRCTRFQRKNYYTKAFPHCQPILTTFFIIYYNYSLSFSSITICSPYSIYSTTYSIYLLIFLLYIIVEISSFLICQHYIVHHPIDALTIIVKKETDDFIFKSSVSFEYFIVYLYRMLHQQLLVLLIVLRI